MMANVTDHPKEHQMEANRQFLRDVITLNDIGIAYVKSVLTNSDTIVSQPKRKIIIRFYTRESIEYTMLKCLSYGIDFIYVSNLK